MIIALEELRKLKTIHGYETESGIYISIHGNFRKGNSTYIYGGICKREECSNHYLTSKYHPGLFCCFGCSQCGKRNSQYGRIGNKNIMARCDVRKKHLESVRNSFYRKIQSEKSKGRKWKEIQRMLLSGLNHWNWKGGISKEPYCQEFTKDLKEYIKYRDGYKCQNPFCYGDCGVLCVHHINYTKKDCQEENLITIGKSCNSTANGDREFWESVYKEIMRRKSLCENHDSTEELLLGKEDRSTTGNKRGLNELERMRSTRN